MLPLDGSCNDLLVGGGVFSMFGAYDSLCLAATSQLARFLGGFQAWGLSHCPPAADLCFPWRWSCSSSSQRRVMNLPIMQSDALCMAATLVVCLSFALLGALRRISL